MASVKIINGIGFSSREGGGMFIDLSASSRSSVVRPMQQTVPYEINKVAPWSPWGVDNLEPQRMLQDIETCGILNGIIEGKSRFAICQGIQPVVVKTDPQSGQKIIDKYVDDTEISEWLEMNDSFFQTFAFVKDLVGFNWGSARFMMSGDRKKIATFQRDDLTEIRFSKQDKKTSVSSHLYYSAEWDKVRSPNDERVFKRHLLSHYNPVADLLKKVESGIVEHAMVFKNPGWGKHYYPTPLWMAAYRWVKIAQGVPEMKQALFENSMRPKYKVIIMEKFWENRFGPEWPVDEGEQEVLKQKVFDEIDEWLVGSKNAHKSIFVNGQLSDQDGKVYTDIDIIPIEDNTRPGELLPDSAAANSEIAFAMLWNNAMTGGNQASGLYESSQGGSNVRESLAMQVIIHEVERQHLRRVMMIPKHVNGWVNRIPGLDFIVPATILTTLDTGGSTKQVNTGGVNEKTNDQTKKAA